MDELKAFRKGDIVRNIYAGDGNPCKYLLFLGKCTIKQGRYSSPGYECVSYDGRKIQLFRDGGSVCADCTLEKVGHMNEFDEFIEALKRLKSMEQEG